MRSGPSDNRPIHVKPGMIVAKEDPEEFQAARTGKRSDEHAPFYDMLDSMEKGDVVSISNYDENVEYIRMRLKSYARQAAGINKHFSTRRRIKDDHAYMLIRRNS